MAENIYVEAGRLMMLSAVLENLSAIIMLLSAILGILSAIFLMLSAIGILERSAFALIYMLLLSIRFRTDETLLL